MMEGHNHLEGTWAAGYWTALRTLLCHSPLGFLGAAISVALSMSTQAALPLPICCWVPLLLSGAA